MDHIPQPPDSEELRNHRQELLHAEKMEAIGRLAGGIAHDFNNLLGGIVGYADLLRMKCASSLPAEAATAQKIVDIARQASTLTSRLLAFARRSNFQAAPLDLHDCINDSILPLDRAGHKKIVIVSRLHAKTPVIIGDKSQLQNVLFNLGENSREAMPDGGTMTFETATVEIGSDLARSYPYAVEPGPFVMLSITDTGVGMDEETRSKAFEPFFTTKTSARGSGLGLATVYGIIKNHGGFIELQSEKGKGTTVTIYLPRATASPATRPERPTHPPHKARKNTNLFVDDERFVRDMAYEALTMLGYAVTPCESGEAALSLIQQVDTTIDLVILDISMPGMNGRECYERLREIAPSIKVIITSGHLRDNEIEALIRNGVCAFLQKPFDIRKLSELVSKALVSC